MVYNTIQQVLVLTKKIQNCNISEKKGYGKGRLAERIGNPGRGKVCMQVERVHVHKTGVKTRIF
jgi:hypothetical protein